MSEWRRKLDEGDAPGAEEVMNSSSIDILPTSNSERRHRESPTIVTRGRRYGSELQSLSNVVTCAAWSCRVRDAHKRSAGLPSAQMSKRFLEFSVTCYPEPHHAARRHSAPIPRRDPSKLGCRGAARCG